MGYYIRQFAFPAKYRSGTKYLLSILRGFVSGGLHAEQEDYRTLIRETGADCGIQPVAVKSAIGRFVTGDWEEFGWAWRRYTGWTQDGPPRVLKALTLLCEGYAPFVKTYREILMTTSSYYIRSEVERLEGARSR